MRISKPIVLLSCAVAALGLVASAGAATIAGTKGADSLSGTKKADVIRGKAGDDTIRGRKGNDRLLGQKGNDTLVGGPGSDHLVGGQGDDLIRAADGFADVIACGPGFDGVIADDADVIATDCESRDGFPGLGQDDPSVPGAGGGDSTGGGSPGDGSTGEGLSDGDGVPDASDLCPNEAGVLTDGCPSMPTPVTFRLDIDIVGGGSVFHVLESDSIDGGGVSDGEGIMCTRDCSADYESGEWVVLIANPAPGVTFAGWGGACPARPLDIMCDVTMDAAKSAIAYFGKRTLTIEVSGLGGVSRDSVVPANGYCDATISPCEWSYRTGTTSTIQANAPTGWAFSGWGGACSGTEPTCTVTLTENLNVTASFRQQIQLPDDPFSIWS